MISALRCSKISFDVLNSNHQKIKNRFCMKIKVQIKLTAMVILYTDNWVSCYSKSADELSKENRVEI